MIPKKINYVWLSDSPMNYMAKKCIKTWKKRLPDYEIKRWSMNDFDFTKMPKFVNQALQLKKWAFVTDYLRLYILYNYGGIYFDSDVLVLKSFDSMLGSSFFSGIELHKNDFAKYKHLVDEEGNGLANHIPGFCMQAAIMGSEKNHPFLKKCMSYYENNNFVNEDGSLSTTFIAPDIFAFYARDFGFKYKDCKQHLQNDMVIYDSSTFAGTLSETSKNNYAIHTCNGSWRDLGICSRIKAEFFKLRALYKKHL